MSLCLSVPVFAAASDGSDPDGPWIPPGQEELLAEMLGRGATLPDECTLAGGHAEYTNIKAAYKCPAGEVVFELAHASRANAPTAMQTENFAIAVFSGSPPEGLADVVASLVRAHENAFEWQWPADDEADATGDGAGDAQHDGVP